MNDEIILELFDSNKKPHKYELLDIVNYNDSEYAVLKPRELFDDEVEIFRIKHAEDKSATFYKAEKDDFIIYNVYEIFKNKYTNDYPNRIRFED